MPELMLIAENHGGVLPAHAARKVAERLGVDAHTVVLHFRDRVRVEERQLHRWLSPDALEPLASARTLSEARSMLPAAARLVSLATLRRALRRVPGWAVRHLVPDATVVPTCDACLAERDGQLELTWVAAGA